MPSKNVLGEIVIHEHEVVGLLEMINANEAALLVDQLIKDKSRYQVEALSLQRILDRIAKEANTRPREA